MMSYAFCFAASANSIDFWSISGKEVTGTPPTLAEDQATN